MIKTIKLSDGIEVEVEVNDNQAFEISDGAIVDASIDRIEGLLGKVVRPISNTYRELNKEMCIESAKVAIGVKIGIEGNFIIAKNSAEANILVEMTMRPKSNA